MNLKITNFSKFCNNNNNNNNNNSIPKTRKYWVDVQQGIGLSHGLKDPIKLWLAIPLEMGFSIKILVWRHFKSTPQFMSELFLLNR